MDQDLHFSGASGFDPNLVIKLINHFLVFTLAFICIQFLEITFTVFDFKSWRSPVKLVFLRYKRDRKKNEKNEEDDI